MELTSAGTAIMLAIAAGLWFLYLVPTWVRRREYLATERTATRLQQTMRVLAETAEVPDAVRIAATARDAARAERSCGRGSGGRMPWSPGRSAPSGPRCPLRYRGQGAFLARRRTRCDVSGSAAPAGWRAC